MSPLKQILNLDKLSKKKTKEFIEKRRECRFIPGTNFPLKGFIKKSEGEISQFKIKDLSIQGVSLYDEGHIFFKIGDQVQLIFKIEESALEVKGIYKYNDEQNNSIGFELKFSNPNESLAYFQFILPVIIGNSFKEMDPSSVNQNDPHYLKKIFFASNDCSLIIFYPKSNTPQKKINFEFETSDFLIRGEESSAQLYFFNKKENRRIMRAKATTHLTSVPKESEEKLRQFFLHVLLNSESNLPHEIKIIFLKLISL